MPLQEQTMNGIKNTISEAAKDDINPSTVLSSIDKALDLLGLKRCQN